MIHLHSLRQKFSERFGAGADAAQIYFSPGRICLIGEHIDYNGGLVLPAAVSLGIYAVFHPTDSLVMKMSSTSEREMVVLNLDDEIIFSNDVKWGNYPAGVIKYLKQEGLTIPGGELLFDSNLPMGAGLSSSAAIEVLTAFLFSSVSENANLSRVALAKLCMKAENDFVGVKCGIMDQYAVAMGQRHRAMVLDCEKVESESVPMALGEYAIVIFNTNKKRELTNSLFNQRVEECSEALNAIRRHYQVKNLADADENMVNELLDNPVAKKRALHVIQENKRVKEAAEALKSGNIQRFGTLLFQSHISLRKQYEVTGPELDAIEEASRNHPDCIGAKMSGAGFGGCAFAIVKKSSMNDFVFRVEESYRAVTGMNASHYFVEIDDGVRRMA